MWINDNTGILLLIWGAVIAALLGIALWLLFSLRGQMGERRLRFTGLNAVDRITRSRYAALTVGNRSLRAVALREIGVKNGGVAFDLTDLYRYKAGLAETAHIVVEQRAAVSFDLSVEELKSLLLDGKGARLKKLRMYAVDLVGTVYEGAIGDVRKLLAEAMDPRSERRVVAPEHRE